MRCLRDQHECCGDVRIVTVPLVQCWHARVTFFNCDVTIRHVTACNFSPKKSVLSVEIFFQNCGGKNLHSEQKWYHRVSNTSNHGERFLLLCTSYRSIYVPCFISENVKKRLTPLDITAVVGATRLQESFRLVVNLRRHMDLFGVFKCWAFLPP